MPVSYTHLDVYKRQLCDSLVCGVFQFFNPFLSLAVRLDDVVKQQGRLGFFLIDGNTSVVESVDDAIGRFHSDSALGSFLGGRPAFFYGFSSGAYGKFPVSYTHLAVLWH